MGAPPPSGVVTADGEDLLDGLDGDARRERAELVEWLLRQGITVAEIRDSVSPMLLAASRLVGADGSYVSARQISESTGVELDLLQRVQRAVGLASGRAGGPTGGHCDGP